MSAYTCPFCAREYHDDPPHCTSDDCPRFEVDFTMEQVGKVYLDGSDTDLVIIVRRRDDDLTPEQAEALILPLGYNDTDRPGAYFCHSVSAVQYPGRSNWCLVMVHRRSDT